MDMENDQPPDDPILDSVLTAAAMVFGKPVRPCDSFFELGGDSIAAVELLVRIAAMLGREPDPDTLISAPDLAAFALVLTRQHNVERGKIP
jgi:acyl carrier protein